MFDGFDPEKVARYDKKKVQALLGDAGIVRNRLKIASAISNAQAFLEVCEEFGSFDAYLRGFTAETPNGEARRKSLPGTTAASDALSKDLQKRGFRFVGSTICYAFMQAVGVVNDHRHDCFRYREIRGA